MESSKLTNILLAIIAVCLLAIALKPMGVLPTVSAQVAGVDDRDRFTAITAASKEAQQVAEATRAIATAIDGLAKSTSEIAKALEGLTRAVTEMGGRLAEGQAGAAAVVPTVK